MFLLYSYSCGYCNDNHVYYQIFGHMSRISVIFFGTSDFAVPALKKLAADSRYQIIEVVTQPDKPAGRKQELHSSPIKVEAEKLGLKILQPPRLSSPTREEEKESIFPPLDGEGSGGVDLFIVASYGKIIPKSVLDIPKHGTLNIHPSLLPKYRGPSPIQVAILNGDTETGVTIIKLDEEMDHGPIVAQRILSVESGILYKTLHNRLAEAGATLLLECLSDYISEKTKPTAQDHSKATFTKIITKDDGRINWQDSVEEIDRQIRAYENWPVAWTTLDGKKLKIFDAAPYNPSQPPLSLRGGVPPLNLRGGEGELFLAGKDLIVHCARGNLEIKKLQLEGAKKITAREFANGYKNLLGKVMQ